MFNIPGFKVTAFCHLDILKFYVNGLTASFKWIHQSEGESNSTCEIGQ